MKWHKLNFVFCHGWGFDQRIMQPLAQALRQYFPEAQYFFYDLGFTGQTRIPEYTNHSKHAYIAIGHSYGFAFLTQQAWPWSAMIALNGFTHFCQLPGKNHGLPLSILDSMYTRLQSAPEATLHEFHQRCGLTAHSIYADTSLFLNRELAKTLTVLRGLKLTPGPGPSLVLATTHDKIVPAGLTNECFALSQVDLKWFPGNHLSLLTVPDDCAATIAHFVTQLYV